MFAEGLWYDGSYVYLSMTRHSAKQKIELSAQPRTVVGDRVRHLRTEGLIPAVLYGKNQEALNVQVERAEFDRVLKQAGESTLVYVSVDGKSYPTIIHDVAHHGLSGAPLHADFYKVNLDEKIKAMVPVVFVGESPAVKSLGGIFVRNVNELEVEALPSNLPHQIEVDISGLTEFGAQISIGDITVADAVLTADAGEIIASITEPISEEELEAQLAEPTTDVSAVEEIKKEKPADEAGEETAGGATEEKAE